MSALANPSGPTESPRPRLRAATSLLLWSLLLLVVGVGCTAGQDDDDAAADGEVLGAETVPEGATTVPAAEVSTEGADDDSASSTDDTTSTTEVSTTTTDESSTTTVDDDESNDESGSGSTATTAAGSGSGNSAGGGSASATGLTVALSPQGLTVMGGAENQLLTFGTDRQFVLAQLEAALGPPDRSGPGVPDCGNGQAATAQWANSLIVDFDADGGFLSWLLPPQSDLETTNGVGIGSPAGQLGGDIGFVANSSLGNEFTAGGFAGLADATSPQGSITNLWSGEVCIFR